MDMEAWLGGVSSLRHEGSTPALGVAYNQLSLHMSLLLGGRVSASAGSKSSKSSRVARAREREPPLGRLGGQLDVTDEAQLLEAADEEPGDVELPRAQPVPG